MTNLSIIIPTIGRKTLDVCIDSFARDLIPGDQVIVMNDGPAVSIAYWVSDYPDVEWVHHVNSPPLGYFGHASRNYALDVYVKNEWFWALDDDDIADENALPAIRDAIESHAAPWYVMRMRFGTGHPANGLTIWSWRDIIVGNVGTPMIVSPVTEERWGTSPDLVVGDGYFGDFEYAQRLQSEIGEPGWREEVVAVIRP